MLNFNDIVSLYPPRLQAFRENILKEYLQYKILDIIFSTSYAKELIFLGGTAIRIVYESSRFSEDLDFDNLSLKQIDFQKIIEIIKKQLELEGYKVEIRLVFSNAFYCYMKFPAILFNNNLSGYKEEKILIRIDSEPQNYSYNPEKFLLNKFGIFRYINVTPISLILAQKIAALLTRKREKGRDFFDVVFLMSKTKPDFQFLSLKLNVNSQEELICRLKEKAQKLNFEVLAKGVEPFLFDPSQKDRVLYFPQWLETIK